MTGIGGTTPYAYAWGAGATPAAASNSGLAAGTYTVTVTDANLCTATVAVTINAGQTLAINPIADIGPVCPTELVALTLLSAVPNNPSIAYSWSGGAGAGMPDGNSTGLNPSIPAFTAGAAEGTWTVTVTASLGACNDTEEFEIEINDAGGLHWVNCPADMTINNDVDKCGANVNWTPPTALDDCDDATVSGPAGGDPGDFFAVGMHTITYEATDGNGNTITCSFKITVADMQLPDAVCKDITVVLDAGTSSCALLDDDFATDPALAPGNVDGSWYPDRYPPSAFVSDAGRLKISISASDGAQLRPPGYSSAFYNTQGRKYNQCGSA
ncbi:MAG: HYR domain-containing protein [Saprospirales bacterium]|nr:HYR domain-containing protein [Saprospirales bacterium]